MFDPLLPSAVTFGATLGYSLKLVWSMGLHREKALLLYVSCGIGKINLYNLHCGLSHLLWLPIWGGKGQAGVQKLHKRSKRQLTHLGSGAHVV